MPAAMWLARNVMAYCRYITMCSRETCHPSHQLCDVWYGVQEMGDPIVIPVTLVPVIDLGCNNLGPSGT